MTFIVETGAGTRDATSYVTTTFITSYLTDRGRETENSWDTLSSTLQEAAAIAATDYIDKHYRFKGARYRKVIQGRRAKGTLTLTANPLDTETLVIGPVTYRFVDTVTDENDILIGDDLDETIDNLVEVVNSGGDSDSTITDEDTLENIEVFLEEEDDIDDAVRVTALGIGTNGNTIVFTTTITGATVTGSGTLISGLDTGPQPLEFPRSGLFNRDGREVFGLPLEVMQATAEYAVRAAAAVLDPDLTVDDSGVPIQKKFEKVGPIEEEIEYVEGSVPRILGRYPGADDLLCEFTVPTGGAVR